MSTAEMAEDAIERAGHHRMAKWTDILFALLQSGQR